MRVYCMSLRRPDSPSLRIWFQGAYTIEAICTMIEAVM